MSNDTFLFCNNCNELLVYNKYIDVFDSNSKIYPYVNNYYNYLIDKGIPATAKRLINYQEMQDIQGSNITLNAAIWWWGGTRSSSSSSIYGLYGNNVIEANSYSRSVGPNRYNVPAVIRPVILVPSAEMR